MGMIIDRNRLPEAPPDHYWATDTLNDPELRHKGYPGETEYVCWCNLNAQENYFIHIGPATRPKATRTWKGQGEDAFYNDMHVAVMCVTLGQWED